VATIWQTNNCTSNDFNKFLFFSFSIKISYFTPSTTNRILRRFQWKWEIIWSVKIDQSKSNFTTQINFPNIFYSCANIVWVLSYYRLLKITSPADKIFGTLTVRIFSSKVFKNESVLNPQVSNICNLTSNNDQCLQIRENDFTYLSSRCLDSK
jgi:hypothetical protein